MEKLESFRKRLDAIRRSPNPKDALETFGLPADYASAVADGKAYKGHASLRPRNDKSKDDAREEEKTQSGSNHPRD